MTAPPAASIRASSRRSQPRALLRDPGILIFDEATSSLGSSTERAITHTIEEIIAGQQQFVTVLIADRIIVLKKGRVAEHGTHLELMRMKGLYYALWRYQGSERLEEQATAPA